MGQKWKVIQVGESDWRFLCSDLGPQKAKMNEKLTHKRRKSRASGHGERGRQNKTSGLASLGLVTQIHT